MQKGSILSYKGWLATVVILVLVLVGAFVFIYHSDNSSNNSNKLVIKELSVEITLPTSLKGTTYSVVKPSVPKNFKYTLPPMVNLEIKQYSTLVSKCLGGKASQAHGDYPYASLSKVAGQVPAADKQVLKQFGTFYIDRLSSGVNVKCSDAADQQEFDNLTKSLNSSLQDTFTSAQQI